MVFVCGVCEFVSLRRSSLQTHGSTVTAASSHTRTTSSGAPVLLAGGAMAAASAASAAEPSLPPRRSRRCRNAMPPPSRVTHHRRTRRWAAPHAKSHAALRCGVGRFGWNKSGVLALSDVHTQIRDVATTACKLPIIDCTTRRGSHGGGVRRRHSTPTRQPPFRLSRLAAPYIESYSIKHAAVPPPAALKRL